jgi:Fe-S cluster assembly scaffold protein SufB
MVMKNVKNAHYWQVDHKVKNIFRLKGVTVLPSPEAWEKLRWTRPHFDKKPKQGYFIWVKQQVDFPLITCISISSSNVFQNLRNLILIEKNVRAETNSFCNTTKKNLCGNHKGYSKIILSKNSELKMRHFHNWGKKDEVAFHLDFLLKKGTKLSHTYKCLEIPAKLKTENNAFLEEDSSANFVTTILARDGEVDIYDSTFLNGRKSNGISRIRVVGDKKSKIVIHSKMIANAAGVGHLDCMGLLLAKNSSVKAIPELINRNKNASLTHEASVGKISEEKLNYLRSRGLSEDEAIDLIMAGFLGEEEPIIIKGRVISSELYM